MNKDEPIIITKVANGYYIKPLSSIFSDDEGDQDIEMMVFSSFYQVNNWLRKHFDREEKKKPISNVDAALLDSTEFVICMRCGEAYHGKDIEALCSTCETIANEDNNPLNIKPIEDEIIAEVQRDMESEKDVGKEAYPFPREAEEDE